jgi:Zn-dependent protease
MDQTANILFQVSIWLLPVLFAITLHEAGHAYVAYKLGDKTAWLLGRVSLNPVKHIDPFGTILLPGMLLLSGSPILFGFAKPVPVNPRALRNPRRDDVLVSAAGPAMNITLAILSALFLHMVLYLSPGLSQATEMTSVDWLKFNLLNSVAINLLLAIFNLLPIPPLDGGHIAVGVLPRSLARPLAELERYGLLILLGLLFLPYLIYRLWGIDVDVLRWVIGSIYRAVLQILL